MRVVTPNLTNFVQLLTGIADVDAQKFIAAKLRLHGWPESPVTGAYILNRQVREVGYQFLYDGQRDRKGSNRQDSSRLPNTVWTRRPMPFFARQKCVHAMRDRYLWVVNRWEAMAFEAVR